MIGGFAPRPCARTGLCLSGRMLFKKSARTPGLCMPGLCMPGLCAPGLCIVRLRKAARSVTVFSARRFPLCACRSVFSAPTVRRRVCGKVRRRFAGGFRKFTGRWFWAGKAQNLRRGRGRGVKLGQGGERKEKKVHYKLESVAKCFELW